MTTRPYRHRPNASWGQTRETTPERFWVDLFHLELQEIRDHRRAAFLHSFLSHLRILPTEMDRGLITTALQSNLAKYTLIQRKMLVSTFQKWVSFQPCPRRLKKPGRPKGPASARSRKVRTKAG